MPVALSVAAFVATLAACDAPVDSSAQVNQTYDDVTFAGPESAVDTAPDAAGDAAAEPSPDPQPEAAPEPLPELPPDPQPEAVPDAAPETVADPAPEAVTDEGPDDGPEATPDAVADAAPEAQSDATPDGGPVLGSWNDPIVVDPLPFFYSGDTTAAPSDTADAYSPCAPNTNESGGEFVFVVTIPNDIVAGTTLSVSVDDVSGDALDIDVQLLDAPSPDACFARDNIAISVAAVAGATRFNTADTWVNGAGVAQAGPFTLAVALVPPGSGGDCLTNPIPQCTVDTKPAPVAFPPQPAGVGNCPPGATLIDAATPFCIDRWEGAVEVVDANGATPWTPYATPPAGANLRAVSAPGVVPQGHISQVQAQAACEGAGKRLCTDTEWLRACQGPAPGTTYPYGPNLVPGVCNDARECHPVVQYFESGADWIWSELDHPCINQLPDSVHLTGDNAGCTSVDGVFDMMGNLHEWTADPTGTFRGGFYKDTVINGSGCLYETTAHNIYHWDYSTGFRCCADPL